MTVVARTALVLAGGQGKRLRPLTESIPKPLLPLGGRRIIDIQMEWLAGHGFKEIFLLVGYLKEKIVEYVGDGSRYGVRVSYIPEEEPLGTGGALRRAGHVIARWETVLVVNGDIVTDIDPRPLMEAVSSGAVASMAVVPLRSPYGIVDVGEDGRVRGFREKPLLPELWVNAGVYAFTARVLEYLPERGDLEKQTFPKLAERGELRAVKYPVPPYYWRSIDTFKDLEEAAGELRSRARQEQLVVG